MNKTYSDQIQKAKMLSAGIKENDSLLKQHGINLDTERIDAIARQLEEASIAQELAEQELAIRRKTAHDLLAELKDLCLQTKQPIKTSFSLELWQKFGLTDKR